MKAFVTAVLLAAAAALCYLFRPFLLDIAIAALMAVATGNLSAYLARKIPGDGLRAWLLSAGLCVLFLGPFVYASFIIAQYLAGLEIAKIHSLAAALKALELPEWLAFARPYIDEFFASADLNDIARSVLGYASAFSGRGMKFLTDLLLIIVFYFFANYYGAALLAFLRRLLPLAAEQWSSLLAQLSSTMSVVFYSVIATAFVEGLLFALIAGAYGYDALFCGICYAFASMIPLIGGALCWLPLAALRLADGDTAGAIVVAAYSIIVISGLADTLLKPLIIRYINDKFLPRRAMINELLIFFAMLAGIGTFGFWGVILGPAILAFFLASANLFTELAPKNL